MHVKRHVVSINLVREDPLDEELAALQRCSYAPASRLPRNRERALLSP